MDFRNSKTKENLMKAFAGESQARNRYTFAAGQARREKLYVIEAVFRFTADQEKEHAEVFYKHLSELAGENIEISGAYPIDIANDAASLLRMAQHNEYEEHDDVYMNFAKKAEEEGFSAIADSFNKIAEIERIHGNRFGQFAEWLEQGKLFVSDVETAWMCMECGHIYRGTQVPPVCPVCHNDRGYFVRLELAPYTGAGCI
ncbi:MAG: rubrerythrin family protein [Lachnospiraceae bacterium]|nr:rubrerythrin family protein [Lachnospiraceae bacterium]